MNLKFLLALILLNQVSFMSEEVGQQVNQEIKDLDELEALESVDDESDVEESLETDD